MTRDEFYKLRSGDIVQNNGSGNSYIVSHAAPDGFIVVRIITISNPFEWDLIERRKETPTDNEANQ